MNTGESRALSFSQLLWRSVRMLASRFPVMLGIILVPTLFLELGGLAIGLFLVPFGPPGTPWDLRAIWMHMNPWSKVGVFLFFLTSIWVLLFACAATIFAVSEAQLGYSLGALGAYRRIRPLHLRLLGLLFFANFVGMAGATALVAFPVAIWLLPAVPIALLENQNVSQAFKRRGVLIEGGRGRIVVLVLAYLVLAVASAYGLVFFLGAVQPHVGPVGMRLLSPISFLVISFVPQLLMIVLTLNYYDQRLRKENWTPESARTPYHELGGVR